MNERSHLFGRASELELLETLMTRAAAGEPTTVFVDGAAGIGKSRLLAEVADRVGALGGLVLKGAAPPMSGEPMPFAAISRLLRDALRQLPSAERSEVIERSQGLGHLQPSWRLSAAAGAPPTNVVAMCEEFVDAIDTLAQGRPLVAVLVDDLQWADAATLDLLAYLARAGLETRILIVAAARLEEVPGDAPIHRVRADLLRIGGRSIALGPLGAEATAEYLASLAGPALSPRRSAEIAALGGGNPLFLQALSEAAENTAGGALPLPETLVALTRARLTRLPASQVTVLQVVATVGDGCTEDLVIRVMGQADGATIADITALVGERILRRVDAGSIEVANPVFREVVLADALEAQLRRIRSAAAMAIAADPQALPGREAESLIRLANLWDGAGDRIRALPALSRAAEAAERTFAFTTAFELYAKALRLIDEGPPTADRSIGFRVREPATDVGDGLADLHARAAHAAILAGDPATAIEWLDRALPATTDPDARDRLSYTRARALLAAGDASGAVEGYRTVRDADVGRSIAGSAQVGYARALISAGEASEAVSVASAALVAARRARSRTDEETALLVLGTALVRAGNLEEGAERLHEARTVRHRMASLSTIRPRASRVMDLTGGLTEAASAAEAAGLMEHAERLVHDAAGAARRWGATGESARLALLAADGAVHDGRWDDALRSLDEAVDHPTTMVAALAKRARIGALRGAWEPAAADLARCEGAAIRSRPGDRAAFAMALTDLRGWRRQSEAAIAAATEGLVLARDAPPDDQLELVALATRGHVDAALGARAMRSVSEAQEHEEIARALVEEASRRPLAAGPRMAALAATAHAEAGRLRAGDVQPWADARVAWESDGAVWWTAYAGFREGEALLASSGRRDAARDVLVRARSIAASLEAAPLLAEIDGLAARGRIELPSRRVDPDQPLVERKLPISDRELEVLVLIAKGLTNKEIAAELFISERTAAHHVGHIFDKLGVSSRVEAAGMAHQAGVLVE